jgi:triacylglycerol lipase
MGRQLAGDTTYCPVSAMLQNIPANTPEGSSMSLAPGTGANTNQPAMAAAPATVTLDPSLTLALAQAAVAAYQDYAEKPYTPPPNYQFFNRFTGWDEWFGHFGREENFGVIFKYIGPERISNRFIVAFRGTSSDSDMLEDSFFEWTTFKSFRSHNAGPGDVSRGFNGIYSSAGGSMRASMQQQLFALLPPEASEVFITGHSLGGALSQLFCLDMRLSAPNVNITTVNFASARVGGRHWQSACDAAGATQRITRIINYYDYVPDVPVAPDPFDQYVSIGTQFQTAFHGKDWGVFDELHRHSMLNLQTVLSNCLWSQSQIWTGTFCDAADPKYQMQSLAPPQQPRGDLVAKLQQLRAAEVASRATSPQPSH